MKSFDEEARAIREESERIQRRVERRNAITALLFFGPLLVAAIVWLAVGWQTALMALAACWLVGLAVGVAASLRR